MARDRRRSGEFDTRGRLTPALQGHWAEKVQWAESSERVDEINGETDGDSIWLMRRLDDELLLSTLLHEALHDSVFVERVTRSGLRRTLSESDEHAIMDSVGLLADD